MRRVGISMNEGDNNRFDFALLERLTNRTQTWLVQGKQYLAFVVEPLLDLKAQVARHQRLMRAFQSVHGGTIAPPKLQNVTKTSRRDQGTNSASTLDDCVGRDRRSVQNGIQVSRLETRRLQRI